MAHPGSSLELTTVTGGMNRNQIPIIVQAVQGLHNELLVDHKAGQTVDTAEGPAGFRVAGYREDDAFTDRRIIGVRFVLDSSDMTLILESHSFSPNTLANGCDNTRCYAAQVVTRNRRREQRVMRRAASGQQTGASDLIGNLNGALLLMRGGNKGVNPLLGGRALSLVRVFGEFREHTFSDQIFAGASAATLLLGKTVVSA